MFGSGFRRRTAFGCRLLSSHTSSSLIGSDFSPSFTFFVADERPLLLRCEAYDQNPIAFLIRQARVF